MSGRCPGVAARWCDRCGQCTCDVDPWVGTGVWYGERLPSGAVIPSYEATKWKAADDCPLHAAGTDHAGRFEHMTTESVTLPWLGQEATP